MTKIDEPTVRACIEAVKADDRLKLNAACYAEQAMEALLPKPVDTEPTLLELHDFLNGAGLINGKFFGDVDDRGYRFWWRKHLHLIQPRKEWSARKEWSDGEIVKELERIPDKNLREARIAAMLRGIEMGRQLAPVAVNPVNPSPEYVYGPEVPGTTTWPEGTEYEFCYHIDGKWKAGCFAYTIGRADTLRRRVYRIGQTYEHDGSDVCPLADEDRPVEVRYFNDTHIRYHRAGEAAWACVTHFTPVKEG